METRTRLPYVARPLSATGSSISGGSFPSIPVVSSSANSLSGLPLALSASKVAVGNSSIAENGNEKTSSSNQVSSSTVSNPSSSYNPVSVTSSKISKSDIDEGMSMEALAATLASLEREREKRLEAERQAQHLKRQIAEKLSNSRVNNVASSTVSSSSLASSSDSELHSSKSMEDRELSSIMLPETSELSPLLSSLNTAESTAAVAATQLHLERARSHSSSLQLSLANEKIAKLQQDLNQTRAELARVTASAAASEAQAALALRSQTAASSEERERHRLLRQGLEHRVVASVAEAASEAAVGSARARALESLEARLAAARADAEAAAAAAAAAEARSVAQGAEIAELRQEAARAQAELGELRLLSGGVAAEFVRLKAFQADVLAARARAEDPSDPSCVAKLQESLSHLQKQLAAAERRALAAESSRSRLAHSLEDSEAALGRLSAALEDAESREAQTRAELAAARAEAARVQDALQERVRIGERAVIAGAERMGLAVGESADALARLQAESERSKAEKARADEVEAQLLQLRAQLAMRDSSESALRAELAALAVENERMRSYLGADGRISEQAMKTLFGSQDRGIGSHIGSVPSQTQRNTSLSPERPSTQLLQQPQIPEKRKGLSSPLQTHRSSVFRPVQASTNSSSNLNASSTFHGGASSGARSLMNAQNLDSALATLKGAPTSIPPYGSSSNPSLGASSSRVTVPQSSQLPSHQGSRILGVPSKDSASTLNENRDVLLYGGNESNPSFDFLAILGSLSGAGRGGGAGSAPLRLSNHRRVFAALSLTLLAGPASQDRLRAAKRALDAHTDRQVLVGLVNGQFSGVYAVLTKDDQNALKSTDLGKSFHNNETIVRTGDTIGSPGSNVRDEAKATQRVKLAARIFGFGPPYLSALDFSQLLKFDTSSREFKETSSSASGISLMTDAVAIEPSIVLKF